LVTERVRSLNDRPVNRHGEYVLYWAQMNRRARCNHALGHAIDLANSHQLPLLVYEGLTCSYPHANDRLHTFILEGVPDNAQDFRALGAGYLFHLRRRQADPNNALFRLAERAAAVVTDDYPTFVSTRWNPSLAAKVACPYLVVDSSCIVPMQKHVKREYAAYTIRPKIQKLLPQYLQPYSMPQLIKSWSGPVPAAELHLEVTAAEIPELVASCEIDHSIAPSLSYRGGPQAAAQHLQHFVSRNLKRYAEGRNEPSEHATSNMSPYLHFGHISSLELALTVREAAIQQGGSADEYLEELIVRRELAFNYARWVERADTMCNLPEWAKKTLREHSCDPRQPSYTREQFERAATHDNLWNACQKEMRLRGKIHGYYRMYWGKKIIEWSPTCQHALEAMVYLHDRYALDGRDPNTYTNILWCFGLHDRPWTERPVFGQIRWMSLDGMKRKTDVDAYLKEIEFLERTGKDPFRLP
jgi:deoxyribodipyrimidine photo-lyase